MSDILCIGAVLWDVIGRTGATMAVGHDVPGRITRLPGGVALNVAMALKRAGSDAQLLSAVGRDTEGDQLIAACDALGLGTGYIHRAPDLPTDQYMAIEAENGLIAAIADAHSLEKAGDAILDPMRDGTIGSLEAPFKGAIVLDGNLTVALLGVIASDPVFSQADLRVAPASPGKVRRLLPLLPHPKLTLYVNRIEAGLLLERKFPDALRAARALHDAGVAQAVVTDGGDDTAIVGRHGELTATPPVVVMERVTGAGDTFLAGHVSAERRGLIGAAALRDALDVTAAYVSGETPV
jgi:pseudouridine kinase